MTEQNSDSPDKKKRILAIIIPLAAGLAAPVLVLLIMALSSGRNVIVKDAAGKFFQARSLFIAGPLVIYSRDASDHATRKAALDSTMEDRSLSAVSLEGIAFIEIMAAPDEGGGGLSAWQLGLKECIGDYVVNAAGNHGYLSLRASGGYVYGTIRFPGWGRGATEYLKGVRIAGNKIYFIRSVTTPQELRRVGGSAYFTQQYSGEYFRSGRLIRGSYTVQGVRKPWEASR